MEFQALHWPPAELRLLLTRAGHSNFHAGQTIFREGDEGDRVYLIRRGLVEIYSDSHGYRQRLALLGRGEVVGEMSVLDDLGRSATALARTDVETRELSKADFEALLDREPTLVRRLTRQLSRRLRETQSTLLTEIERQTKEEARAALTVIGPYELGEELGKGAVGVVYKAVNRFTRHEYALKILTILNDAQRQRFHRECEIMARLIHPNIARIESAGVEGSYGYLAMELLKGETLERRLTRGPMTQTEIRQWFVPALEAMHHAHGVGVLHRDIKPANLYFTFDGVAKLLDLGIARRANGPEMTVEGRFLGTANYIAPERIGGHSANPERRSDQYSFGVTLYQAVTGQLPFPYEDIADVLAAHLHRPPLPPSRIAPVSPKLEAVILRLLEKDPARRFPSMAAAAEALSEATGMEWTVPAGENATIDLSGVIKQL